MKDWIFNEIINPQGPQEIVEGPQEDNVKGPQTRVLGPQEQAVGPSMVVLGPPSQARKLCRFIAKLDV